MKKRLLIPLTMAVIACVLNGCTQPASRPDGVTLVGNGTGSPQSTDVAADIETMWSVSPKRDGQDWVTSSPEADAAAERVFNSVNLIGLPRDAVTHELGMDMRSKDYGYYLPFYPVATNVITVRIDNGHFGWQFDIVLDDSNRVVRVERRGIE